MLEAARKAVELANAGRGARDEHLRRREHASRLPGPDRLGRSLLRPAQPRVRHARCVAGTNPKRAGTDVEGIPVFAHGQRSRRADRRDGLVHLRAGAGRGERGHGGGRGGHHVHRGHHRGRAGPGRGALLQSAAAGFPERAPARAELPGHHHAGQVQHRHHRGRDRHAGRAGRHRQSLGHADLPGAVRADPEGHRRDDLRRHRRRPGAGHDLHRLPARPSRPTPRRGRSC